MKPAILLLSVATLFAHASLAQAALMKPESPEGRRLVHRLADEASRVFVDQSLFIQGNTETEINEESLRASCETTKSTILADLETLELKGASDLLSAKASLEKVNCPAAAAETEEGSPAGATDIRQAHDRFFTATVYLRSSDIFN